MLQTAILVFNDVEELDFIGPWEILKSANKVRPGTVEVRLISKEPGVVRAFNGLRFYAEGDLASVPAPDLLIVPGGQGRRVAMKDAEILEDMARRGKTVGDVARAFWITEAQVMKFLCQQHRLPLLERFEKNMATQGAESAPSSTPKPCRPEAKDTAGRA